jgi:anti-sigma factor RsiW
MTTHIAPDRLSSYLDGELGTDQLQDVETHLAQCRDCSADYEAMLGSQRRVRREATRFAPPAALRKRIVGQIRGGTAAKTRPPLALPWWSAAAAMAFTAVFAVVLTLKLEQPRYRERLDEEITASHVRSLIGDRSADVASSDQHTVKPWFSGKLDFSPPVRDFVDEGFPLVGGRVDYIGKRRVAVLVYRRRQHLIDVYVWPADERAAASLNAGTIDGFHIEHATGDGMAFVGISDVNRDDLRTLMALLRGLQRPSAELHPHTAQGVASNP